MHTVLQHCLPKFIERSRSQYTGIGNVRIELKQVSRTCGECTLCCKVLGIKELEKPPNEYCQHAIKGKGCGVYETRPESCQDFRCLWLEGGWPEWAKPSKIHGVLGATDNGENLILWEDPGYPGVASGHLKDIFKNLVASGQIIIVACGDKRTLLGNREVIIKEIDTWKQHVAEKNSRSNVP